MKLPKCKLCSKEGHYKYQCFLLPKKAISKLGKQGRAWQSFRANWFYDNQAEFYYCYLCGVKMLPAETTLDHIIPRSRDPKKRYDPENIKVCCYSCNSAKGSKVLSG